MVRGKLKDADEYKQLFQFFFLFRAIALLVGFLWLIARIAWGENHILGLAVWVALLFYTVVIYSKHRKLYKLVLEHPSYFAFDVFVSAIILMVYNAFSSPFFFYSISPVIPAAVLFRFKGATISSVLLSVCQVVSLSLHGGTPGDLFSSRYFANFLGQTMSFFTVGYMSIYPADMIAEILGQRSIIKTQAEKQAALEERLRLAREFHDNPAQIFSGIKLKSKTLLDSVKDKAIADELESIASAAEDGYDVVNQAIFSLREDTFKDKSLSEIFKKYCRKLGESGFQVRTNFASEPAFPEVVKAEIFRICQEALTNARKHSGKNWAVLSLSASDGHFIASVKDDGAGFDAAKVDKQGFGLQSMQERAKKLGANLNIKSQPNQGTFVSLALPLSGLEEG